MTDSELTYRIAFSLIRGNNRIIATELLSRIGTEEGFFNASSRLLEMQIGKKSKFTDNSYRNQLLDKARKEVEFINKNNISPIYFKDENYPQRLLDCDDAPLMLYTLGICDINNSHLISIVGTRHATHYGVDMTERIIEGLAKRLDNIIIVSGLAYGIDIAAHRAALKNGIPTIAVLAHGLNTIYPAAHRNVAAEMIKQNGMLVTDYTSTDNIHRGNFLARNRIVAGLCDCIIVAESAEKGGAIVTAGIADGYNRDVLVLPGRANDPYSQGCNKLIASGRGALISSAQDVIDTMRWTAKPQEGEQSEMFADLNEDEQKILNFIGDNPLSSINELSIGIDIPISKLTSTLIDMEFRGLIVNYPGGRYDIS